MRRPFEIDGSPGSTIVFMDVTAKATVGSIGFDGGVAHGVSSPVRESQWGLAYT